MFLAEVDPIRIFFVIVLVVVCWLGPAYWSARYAATKGYGSVLFFVIGLILGLLTPLLVLFLPNRRDANDGLGAASFIRRRRRASSRRAARARTATWP